MFCYVFFFYVCPSFEGGFSLIRRGKGCGGGGWFGVGRVGEGGGEHAFLLIGATVTRAGMIPLEYGVRLLLLFL